MKSRWLLTWLTIAFSAAAILATTYIIARQRSLYQQTSAAFSELRLSRIDLSEGLLRALSAKVSAEERSEGLALVRQSGERFEGALRAFKAVFPIESDKPQWLDHVTQIRGAYAELSASLKEEPSADAFLPPRLRVSSYTLEREAEVLDAEMQGRLQAYLWRLDEEYLVTLWIAAAGLVGLCGVIYALARSEAEANRALRESRQLLDSIVDNTPSLIYVFDDEGRCVLSNKRHADLFGRAPREMIGKRRSDWMAPEFARLHETHDLKVLASGGPIAFEETVQGPDGPRHYLSTKFPLGGEGSPRAIGGISTDITERKSMEDALKKALEERNILLKELNHRTKNNMQVISSWLSLQASKSKNAEVKEALREADSRVQAIALVHRMLYQSENLSIVNLADYLRELGRNLLEANSAEERGIRAEFGLEGVNADIEVALPCGFIVSELITNSLKHAFPRDRKGTIRISLHKADSGEIELHYSDDGIGFMRSAAQASSGGLGLETIEAIGEGQLHGSVRFETEGGFDFRLLFRDSDAQTGT
jgi:PAS domain S-box-containing protein